MAACLAQGSGPITINDNVIKQAAVFTLVITRPTVRRHVRVLLLFKILY